MTTLATGFELLGIQLVAMTDSWLRCPHRKRKVLVRIPDEAGSFSLFWSFPTHCNFKRRYTWPPFRNDTFPLNRLLSKREYITLYPIFPLPPSDPGPIPFPQGPGPINLTRDVAFYKYHDSLPHTLSLGNGRDSKPRK